MQDERAEVNTSETNTETDTHKSKEAKRAERGRHKQGQAVIIFVGDLPDKTSDTFEKFQRIFSLC